jgi:hypothetical protein
MGTGGPFPGSKARPKRNADYSPPYSAEVENEKELYLLSPKAPSWRVEGLLFEATGLKNMACKSPSRNYLTAEFDEILPIGSKAISGINTDVQAAL